MDLKKRTGFPSNTLSRMQLYIGEELVEKHQAGLISWAQMLRSLILVAGSAAAAATLLASSGENVSPPAKDDSGAIRMSEIKFQPPSGPLVVDENDPAVKGEMVSFESTLTIHGYLAQPTVPGKYPGVIVIHEANGLSDHTKDVTRRLAKAGFIAFAPDLLSRWGITPELPFEKMMGYLGNAKPEEILADLNSSVDYLAGQPNVLDKLGVVGFCFGGGYSLNLAAVNPKINASVCYYGVTPQPASQMTNTQAAILSHYAGTDQRVNATVPELEAVLGENGKTFEKHFYQGANHGFNNDTVSILFNENAAVLAWERTLNWFNHYLKA